MSREHYDEWFADKKKQLIDLFIDRRSEDFNNFCNKEDYIKEWFVDMYEQEFIDFCEFVYSNDMEVDK